VDRISLYIIPLKGEMVRTADLLVLKRKIEGQSKICGTLLSKSSGKTRIDIFEQFTSTEDAGNFVERFNRMFDPYQGEYKSEFMGGAYFSWQVEGEHAKSQLWGFIFAISIICVLFLFLYGTRAGIMAAAENCWPILAVVALVNLIGMKFNFVTILIANLIIGLAVEDTIYLMNRYRKLKAEGLSSKDAFSQSAVALGNSSVFSSIIMAVGFSLLMLSLFNPTFQLGLLSTFAIIVALFADLIILPLLLYFFDY